MFHEAIHHVLLFIGSRACDEGCTSVELGEYIDHDVIPYLGWSPNEIIRTSIMRLTVDRHYEEMRISLLNQDHGENEGESRLLNDEKRKKSKLNRTNKLAETDAIQQLVHGEIKSSTDRLEEGELSKEKVLGLFDDSLVATRQRIHDSQRRRVTKEVSKVRTAEEDLKILRFFPLLELTEKLFGLPLRVVAEHETARFACLSAVEGIDPSGGKQGSEGKGKHLITMGIREFLRRGVLRVVFLLDVEEKLLYKRYFPIFALPSTSYEREKSPKGVSKKDGKDFSFSQQQYPPLDHYYERHRRLARLRYVVLDLSLMKHVIVMSPERKLLLQDAVDMVLKAHEVIPLRWHELSKRCKEYFHSAFSAAGLSVVKAQIFVHGTSRLLKLVIPAEDWAMYEREKNRESLEAVASVMGKEMEDGDGNFDASGDDDNPNEVVSSELPPIHEKLIAEARKTFFFSPNYPRWLQFCQQAEQRGMSLVGSFPSIRFRDQRLAKRIMGNAVQQYFDSGTKLRRMNVILFSNTKQLSFIYFPDSSIAASSEGTQQNEPSSGGAQEGTEITSTEALVLPPGISFYGIETVLGALRTSRFKALTLPYLGTLIDYVALNRRILPFLRDSGKVITTGYTRPGKRRIGIVALANVTLTEETKRLVVEAQAADTDKKPELSIQKLPSMLSGEEGSKAREQFDEQRIASRTSLMVYRVMMVRNGYSRFTIQRASRLHLELWYQFYQFQEKEKNYGRWNPSSSLLDVWLSLDDVYESMTLSTFCIVIGVPRVDLGVFQELNLSSGSANENRIPGQLTWNTPISELPPSLQEWCRTQGNFTFLASTRELWKNGLIHCKSSTSVDFSMYSFFDTKLADISVSLVGEGVANRITYNFYPSARSATPGGTAYAALLYWQNYWRDISTHSFHLLSRKNPHLPFEELNKVLTLNRFIAVSKLLRLDVMVLGELLFLRCGQRILRPERSAAGRLRDICIQSKKSKSPSSTKRRSRGLSHRPSSIAVRVELSGVNLSNALRLALKTSSPLLELERVLKTILRIKQNHIRIRTLFPGALSRSPSVVVQMESSASSTHPWKRRKILECSLPSAAYNRHQSLNVLHLGHLTELVGQRCQLGVKQDTIGSPFDTQMSEMKGLRREVGAVLSPDAAVWSDALPSSLSLPTIVSTESEAAVVDNPSTLSSELWEVLLDVLRCILLSDKAHYHQENAKSFVLSFPEADVKRARDYLLRQTAFQRGVRRGRIPYLALAATPSILPASLAKKMPRMCTNAVVMQGCVASLDRYAACYGGLPSHPLLSTPDVVGKGKDEIEVSLREPVKMDAKLMVQSEALLASLTLVSLKFSPKAFVLDGRQSAASSTSGSAVAENEWLLYPARRISDVPRGPGRATAGRRHLALELLADSIPVDPTPSPEETAAVAAALTAIRENREPTHPISKHPHPVPFPSIFHHIDGAFHTYVWEAFLDVLFRLITRAPGIGYHSLQKNVMATGLISRRSLDAGLSYMLDMGDLIGREALPGSGSFTKETEGATSPFALGVKRQREESEATLSDASVSRDKQINRWLEGLYYYAGVEIREVRSSR